MQKYAKVNWRPQLVSNPQAFLAERPHVTLVDTFIEQVRELYAVLQPDTTFDEFRASLYERREHYWVSWRNVLVVLLPPWEHDRLVGARNRVLFSDDDRQELASKRVGIAGMSVGSRVLEPLAHGPAIGLLRLADMDTVSGTSLNRLPAGIADLGTPKVLTAARLVTEVRPQAPVALFPYGLNEDNLDEFVRGLDIVVCAMDDPRMKLRLREVAARMGVDVVMGTDVEQGIVDFEPYATDPGYQPFHGALSDATLATLSGVGQQNPQAMIAAIAEIVDLRNLTLAGLKMAAALAQGHLASMSQLATTATSVGGVVARLIHLRLTGSPVQAGRIVLGLETALSGPASPDESLELSQVLGALMAGLQPAPRVA